MRQKRNICPRRSIIKMLMFAVVLAAAFCIGPVAGASAETSTVTSPAVVSPAEAKAILLRAAEYMAKAQSFSVEVRDNYDAYQESGQKIEYNETRKIIAVRPDRLRVEVEESDGDKGMVIFDGNTLSMSNPKQNVYAQTPKPGTIDNAIVYFVHDLGMKLPFAVLILTTAPQEIEQRTQKIDYVEKTSIFGAPAYHLAGRTESVDYQVWIADGDKPLLQRLVLTYRNEKGQPQFRAQLSNWNFAPETSASMFEFVPPEGAQRISFLAQLPRSAEPAVKHKKSKKSGDNK